MERPNNSANVNLNVQQSQFSANGAPYFIYSFWIGIALEKWKVKHTTFA